MTFSPRKISFSHVEMAPKDPILGITENFLADKSSDKINLGVVRSSDQQSDPNIETCAILCHLSI